MTMIATSVPFSSTCLQERKVLVQVDLHSNYGTSFALSQTGQVHLLVEKVHHRLLVK